MKKLFFILGIGSIFFLFLSACSNDGNSEYDEAIDKVIELQNESLDRGGVETDIDTLKREDTKIKVFDEGKYIQIFFNIRKNDEVNKLYEKVEGSYKQVVEEMEGKEPVYTENIEE
ncbi:cystatin-like fold lipoprotein [Virgibacillus salexigens]|uniref:cystatin-like fold lipoprotein n=1 Tax=Virgibacillus salexigens TaxID=61016 RepID=UPI0030815FFA